MIRERVQQRWQEPDTLLPPNAKSREEAHARVLADIAVQRFGFPTPEHPNLHTFLNEPQRTFVIKTPDGSELTPDIVVAETPGNVPKILAEVETSDTVTVTKAEREWRAFSMVPDTTFYLYVPSGYGSVARDIIKKRKIRNVGLRTWRYVTGQESLDITDLTYGHGSVLELLLPPFLLERRR